MKCRYEDENKDLECENDFALIKEINALNYENNETSKNDENIKNKVLINKVEGEIIWIQKELYKD